MTRAECIDFYLFVYLLLEWESERKDARAERDARSAARQESPTF